MYKYACFYIYLHMGNCFKVNHLIRGVISKAVPMYLKSQNCAGPGTITCIIHSNKTEGDRMAINVAGCADLMRLI